MYLFFIILFINSALIKCEYHHAVPIQPSMSRLLKTDQILTPDVPRIRFEQYKALAGETVRLECPQPNPTWFFRHLKGGEHDRNFNIGGPGEDLIVTRHGIINADYKYKIMCHMTLKHKVIIINNVGFDEEGLYTCLYTQPTNNLYYNNNGLINSETLNSNSMQFRYVFNVTVYTLINGLSMEVDKTINKPTIFPKSLNTEPNKKEHKFDLIDNTVTVKENEELSVNCVVDRSKPAANINFSTMLVHEKSTTQSTEKSAVLRKLKPLTSLSTLESLVSSRSNIVQNNDRTYKTMFSARLKASPKDHGKIITCKADNGFSNQKWENKKVLNVLFKPICKDPPNFVYHIGINQTLNVKCNILNANPAEINYDWELGKINANLQRSSIQPNIINNHMVLPNSMNGPNMGGNIFSPHSGMSNSQGGLMNGYKSSFISSRQEPSKILGGFKDKGFMSSFKFRPSNMNDFGRIVCTAKNEIGSTECSYNIKLGGVPNPPTDCTHNMKNTSAIISCLVGFHQGDPDIYCYLLRKSENGVYKEHTRNRESCSFIVNDVNLKKLNEFWIYSSNKHGHNKDNGVHLTIGEAAKLPVKSNSKSIFIAAIIIGLLIFLLLACCFSFKIRKGLNDDNDSIFEGEAYQTKNQATLISNKKNNSNNGYQAKIMKGVKISNHDSSYDINDHIKDSKLLINELKSKKMFDSSGDPKLKKYTVFKTDTSVPQDKIEIHAQSMYTDKYNGQGGILLHNGTYQQRVKKSISFTKPLVNEKSKGDMKESVPLYDNHDVDISSGLLTTVLNQTSSILSDSNKMVTFGTNPRKFTNQHNLSGSASVTSTNASSTSPATSTTNNDSEYTNNTPDNLSDSTNPEQSFSLIKPKLSTFSNNSPYHQKNEIYANHFTPQNSNRLESVSRSKIGEKNDKLPPLPTSINKNSYSKPNSNFSSDILETKFLNKLCEDIEVSLNVDCECADDYSSNDFSGDYSFDNELMKTPLSMGKINYQQQRHNSQPGKINPLQNKINNLEQNIKLIRNNNNNSNPNYHNTGQNKNQIGVLV